MWHQCSCTKDEDNNKRFLHNHASSTRQSNTIMGITNLLEEWQTSQVLIPSVFIDYFANLFKIGVSICCNDLFNGVQDQVTELMNQRLSMSFTTKEVQVSLFQMYLTLKPLEVMVR